MGNCCGGGASTNPGSVLDRVISQSSNDDDCLLYKLANYKKGGELIDAYNIGGAAEVEKLIREQFGILMYQDGKGQMISRTEYLRWKFRNQKHVVIPVEASSATDPLAKWEDHEACWQMQYRGSLGETLLHVLIICDTRIHSRLARILIKCFPKLAIDAVEGEEYLGASALHLAIAYNNNELVHLLVQCGARINQRAIGSFFLPKDQQRLRPAKVTDYEGLAYLGEYPLAWSACMGNESAYNLLIDSGANPDLQDSFGNMILHMVVVTDQLGMFGYALRHPRVVASNGIVNLQGLTPLTLACRLGRAGLFREMLELSCREFWRYSNITCSAYPLNALDTIMPDGSTNWNSALFMILAGSKEEHLDMLDGGIIQRLLEEKWKTFAQRQFFKRITMAFLHIMSMSFAIYLRPLDRNKDLMAREDYKDVIRLVLETSSMVGSVHYVIFQQGEEIRNQGIITYFKQLPSSPPKTIFLLANFMLLYCIVFRLQGDLEMEETFIAFGMVGSWFFMMFFAGMITGDMLTFGIIFVIMLLGFSQAFFFLFKSHPAVNGTLFDEYHSTWMALYQMTLGSYDYSKLGETGYPNMAKSVFIIFMIMVPILLLNMLIAMMGNTYSQVIERSEKEWIKQWAKLVVALERSVSQEDAKKYINEYSIKLGGSDPSNEVRGVMVIKSKSKTRANQRKGAVSNWKRVGKVTIQALKKRNMTGEEMRCLMWGHRNSVCTPQATTPRQQSMDLGNQGQGDKNALHGLNNALDQLSFSKVEGLPVSSESISNSGTALAPSPNHGQMGAPTCTTTGPTPSLTTNSLAPPSSGFKETDVPLSPCASGPTTPTTSILASHVTPVIEKSPMQSQKKWTRRLKFSARPKVTIYSNHSDTLGLKMSSDESEIDELYDIMRRPPTFQIKSPLSGVGFEVNDDANEDSSHDGNGGSDTGREISQRKRGGAVNFAFEPEEFAENAITKIVAENMLQSGLILSPQPFLDTASSAVEIQPKRDKTAKSKKPHKAKAEGESSTEALISNPSSPASSAESPPLSNVEEVAVAGSSAGVAVPSSSDGNFLKSPSTDDDVGNVTVEKQRREKKYKKKTHSRSKSARNGNKIEPSGNEEEEGEGSGKQRPITANDRWSTKGISNMNKLVAWDRPEDDI